MAITHIHAITKRLDKAVNYCLDDKLDEYREGISNSIEYAINDKTGKVVYKTLNSTWNCQNKSEVAEFNRLVENGKQRGVGGKPKHKSGEDVVAWHLIQSFDGIEVSPETANEIGYKLTQEIFKDFASTISTHTNKENIHNHIMICAWNMHGGKWNNCNDNYRKIRNVSDRLCEEYGLSVNYKTQDMKLIRYVDEKGRNRYYEPTSRKNGKIAERGADNVFGDVNDYRNTPGYDEAAYRQHTNREIIKNDIDSLIPVVRSYDELLYRLCESGYTINDKKKNGDWLKHVSFTAPGQEKPTRDNTLGDKVFYTREVLTKYFEDRGNEQHFFGSLEDTADGNYGVDLRNLPFFPTYEYGTTRLEGINEDYRVSRSTEGDFKVVRRSAIEKEAVISIKSMHIMVKGLLGSNELEHIIETQRRARLSKRKYRPGNAAEKIVHDINRSIRYLSFIENNRVHSVEQLKQMHNSVKDKHKRTVEKIKNAEALLNYLRSIADSQNKLTELRKKLKGSADNVEYMSPDNAELLKSYQDSIVKHKLDTPEGISSLRRKIEDTASQIAASRLELTGYKKLMEEYDDYISVLEAMEMRKNEAMLTASAQSGNKENKRSDDGDAIKRETRNSRD